MSILPQLGPWHILKCARPNDAKRIVKRALRREWCVLVFTHEGNPYVALDKEIDLKSDLRDRLANIDFVVIQP